MHKYISAPNYFGEIVEWIGWAILTWSISGLVFALWTIANLFKEHLLTTDGIKKNLMIILKIERLLFQELFKHS